MLRLVLRKQAPADKLEELAVKFAEHAKRIQEIRRKHGRVFHEIEKHETEMEAIRIEIQNLARKKSKQGETVHLVTNEHVKVYVSGNQRPIAYDFEKAVRYWPEEILARVMVVDHSKVMELVKKGVKSFNEKLVEKAQLPREAGTPAVTIKPILKK